MASSFAQTIASMGYEIQERKADSVVIVRKMECGAAFIVFDQTKRELYGSFGPTCLVHTLKDIDNIKESYEELQKDLDSFKAISGYALLVG